MYRYLRSRAVRRGVQLVAIGLWLLAVLLTVLSDSGAVLVSSVSLIGLVAFAAIKLSLVALVTADNVSERTESARATAGDHFVRIDARLDRIGTSLEGIERRVGELAASARDTHSDLKTLSAEYPEVRARLSNLSTRVGEVEVIRGELNAARGELETVSRLLEPYATLLELKEQELMALRERREAGA